MRRRHRLWRDYDSLAPNAGDFRRCSRAQRLLYEARVRRALLLFLGVVGCSLSESSQGAVNEALGRALWCGVSSGGRQSQPPEVGVFMRGRVLVGGRLNAVPASYAKLDLERNGYVVASTATDRHGR